MTKNLLITLVGLGLVLLAGAGIALADGNVSFGIRPTKAQPGRPETFSYFIHELVAGSVISDAALVMNSGDVPITLKLYAADGMTAINGGTAFAQQGQETNGVSRWLSLSVAEVSLEPGEEIVVPFTISVPSDALPGQHVAGLVAELGPNGGDALPGGEGQTQFSAKVIRQAGVAVVIEIPGPWHAGLEITDISLRQQDDQGATFVVAVRNTGNTFLKGEGSLLVTDREGKELAVIPLKMDTVLPGDATTFQITYPVNLADGRYLLNAVLEYADGETALLEGAAVNVIDGQPEVKVEAKGPDLQPHITQIVGSPEESSKLFFILLAVSAILALVPVYLIGRWAKGRLTR